MNQAKTKTVQWLAMAVVMVCSAAGQTAPAAPASPGQNAPANTAAPVGAAGANGRPGARSSGDQQAEEQSAAPEAAPMNPGSTPGPAGGAKSAAKITISPVPPGVEAEQTGPLQGKAIDRVVAVVNGDLILESDVDEERRMAVLQPVRDPSGEFSREQAIERLINRALILQQAKLGQQVAVSDEDVDAELKSLRKEIPACTQYHCETEAGWAAFLKANGLTEAEVRRRWTERMQVLRYIELRFRSGVQITPRERRDYYEQHLLPEFKRRGIEPPALNAVSQRIEEVLLQQQVTNLLQDWLKSLRAQGSVQMMKPGEMAP